MKKLLWSLTQAVLLSALTVFINFATGGGNNVLLWLLVCLLTLGTGLVNYRSDIAAVTSKITRGRARGMKAIAKDNSEVIQLDKSLLIRGRDKKGPSSQDRQGKSQSSSPNAPPR